MAYAAYTFYMYAYIHACMYAYIGLMLWRCGLARAAPAPPKDPTRKQGIRVGPHVHQPCCGRPAPPFACVLFRNAGALATHPLSPWPSWPYFDQPNVYI